MEPHSCMVLPLTISWPPWDGSLLPGSSWLPLPCPCPALLPLLPLLGVWVWAQGELPLSMYVQQDLRERHGSSCPSAALSVPQSIWWVAAELSFSPTPDPDPENVLAQRFHPSGLSHPLRVLPGAWHVSLVAGQRGDPGAGGLCSQGTAHPHPNAYEGVCSSCKYHWARRSITLNSK